MPLIAFLKWFSFLNFYTYYKASNDLNKIEQKSSILLVYVNYISSLKDKLSSRNFSLESNDYKIFNVFYWDYWNHISKDRPIVYNAFVIKLLGRI